MDETELMIELGRTQFTEPILHSPASLLEKAKTYLARVRPELQALICPHRELTDLPEIELATTLVALLIGSFTSLSIASIIAAYIAKRGVTELCQGWSGNA
jgi:hypothetical protein